MTRDEWETVPEGVKKGVEFLFQSANIDLEKIFSDNAEAKTMPPEQIYLTRKEAAKIACVSTDTIDNWCKNNNIDSAKCSSGRPGRVIISKKSLERFLKAHFSSKRVSKSYPTPGGYYRVSAE